LATSDESNGVRESSKGVAKERASNFLGIVCSQWGILIGEAGGKLM
jgi:hypothetical protein